MSDIEHVGYDFGKITDTELADLREEQDQALKVTGAKYREARDRGDVDSTAVLELEVLSGFELLNAADAEMRTRAVGG